MYKENSNIIRDIMVAEFFTLIDKYKSLYGMENVDFLQYYYN